MIDIALLSDDLLYSEFHGTKTRLHLALRNMEGVRDATWVGVAAHYWKLANFLSFALLKKSDRVEWAGSMSEAKVPWEGCAKRQSPRYFEQKYSTFVNA